MKNLIVSVVSLASAACSPQPRPADEPVTYVEPSAEAKDPLGGPTQGPVTRQNAPVNNEIGSLGPNADRNIERDVDRQPSTAAYTSNSPSTSAAPVVPAAAASVTPDNTGVNKRDRNSNTLTPLDQSNKQTDLNITQAIRKAVIAKDGFSFNAKNVKIITAAGNVTLRGPVKTVAERETIASIARGTAGVLNVDDQLEVKP